MKTFGKIIICIIVILLAVGTAYLIHNNQTRETNNNNISNTNSNTILNNENVDNEKSENDVTSENKENTEYIGEEEQSQEEIIENEETKNNENQDDKDKQEELTGKDKAIDIVTKKYAMEGEIVKFDHMEGNSYVIKINAGTAVTWYLVDGTTWEASEY